MVEMLVDTWLKWVTGLVKTSMTIAMGIFSSDQMNSLLENGRSL